MHFHTLVAQGVFIEDAEEGRRFVPLPAPTDREVGRLLAAVRRRIVRLVARHGIDLEDPSSEATATDWKYRKAAWRPECIWSPVPAIAELVSNAWYAKAPTDPMCPPL